MEPLYQPEGHLWLIRPSENLKSRGRKGNKRKADQKSKRRSEYVYLNTHTGVTILGTAAA
jgi:hypothetical protein